MGIETSILRFSSNAKSFSLRPRRIVRVRHPCASSPGTKKMSSCQVIGAACATGSFFCLRCNFVLFAFLLLLRRRNRISLGY